MDHGHADGIAGRKEDAMKNLYVLLGGGLFLIASVLGGCATAPSERPTETGPSMSQSLGDKAFHYHRQAAELRDMARRLEMEAEWYAQQAGKDSEQAKHAREMAKGFWATAEEADQRAREHQSRLPHGQLY
jgi:hypothetical protein